MFSSQPLRELGPKSTNLIAVPEANEYWTALPRQGNPRRKVYRSILAYLPGKDWCDIVRGVMDTYTIFSTAEPSIKLDTGDEVFPAKTAGRSRRERCEWPREPHCISKFESFTTR